jgi:1,4-dihydroxy-2-naphthoyl-CoA hydrolase
MAIWFKPYTIEQIQQRGKGTMLEYIDIHITELGENYLKGTMPVDHRTMQPMGILHGGASVVMAESLGSLAASLVVNPEKNYCVGIDINANHIRAVKAPAIVTGIAKPIHIGSTTQVWSIEISNEEGKLVCVSRLTMAVLRMSNESGVKSRE